MASVLTNREQRETSEVARKVGGYSELIRLEGDLRRLERSGVKSAIERDQQSGRYSVVAASHA